MAADADDDEEWNEDYRARDSSSGRRDADESEPGYLTLPAGDSVHRPAFRQAWDTEADGLANPLQKSERAR